MKTLTWPRAVGAAAALALLVVVVAREPWLRSEAPASPGSAPSVAAVAAGSSSPPSPPARICGSSRLRGPATRPAHAVRVSPTQHLPALVASKAAGTTFWLAPGVHVLGGGAYDSVRPKSGDTFIGAPGAVIGGQHAISTRSPARRSTSRSSISASRTSAPPVTTTTRAWSTTTPAATGPMRWTTVRTNAGAGVMIGSGNVISQQLPAQQRAVRLQRLQPIGVAYVTSARSQRDRREQHRQLGSTANRAAAAPAAASSGTRGAPRLSATTSTTTTSVGLWADTNNRGFLFEGNYIADNDWPTGSSTRSATTRRSSTTPSSRNADRRGPDEPGLPDGRDLPVRVRRRHAGRPAATADARDLRQRFTDNWAGVIVPGRTPTASAARRPTAAPATAPW